MAKQCVICHKTNRQGRMFQNGYYSNIWMHSECMGTEKTKKWHLQRQREDAGYNRYVELTNDGALIKCDKCGHENIFCVKAFGPAWEACCDQCHKVNKIALDAYAKEDEDIFRELQKLNKEFLLNSDDKKIEKIEKAVELISSQNGPSGKCSCGGEYLIAARPRCIHCNQIVFDSYFHYVDIAT